MDYQAIIAGTVGKENTYGTIVGRVKPGPFTYCRVSTDRRRGRRDPRYVRRGQGHRRQAVHLRRLRRDPDPGLPEALLRHICEHGFEHHVCGSLSSVAAPVAEALGKYKRWAMYQHA
jgi:L-fucose isomerase-like protein